jgi:hypothetical protein
MKKLLAALVALFLFTPAFGGEEIFKKTGTSTAFNITTSTVVKTGDGMLVGFAVLVAGAAGTINDAATTGAVAASNQLAVTPAAVGVYPFTAEFTQGLVVAPGAGQTVVAIYQ